MKPIVMEIVCAAGALAIFLAALGLVRFPDFFTRAHAATKASAFGLAGFLLAHGLAFPTANVILKSIFALIALFLTLPVASQALAAAVRRKNDAGTSAPKDFTD